MNDPKQVAAVVARYQQYADEWRAEGRVREAKTLEILISLLVDGTAKPPLIVERKVRNGERLLTSTRRLWRRCTAARQTAAPAQEDDPGPPVRGGMA